MFFDLLRLATTNLFRARVRLTITASGVLIGTAAVILLMGLTNGLQQSAEAGLGDNELLREIYVYPNFISFNQSADEVPQITFAIIDQIRQLRGVEVAVAVLPLVGQGELRVGRLRKAVLIFGANYNELPYLGINVVQGDLAELPEGAIVAGVNVQDTFRDENDPFVPVVVDIFQQETLVLSNQAGDSSRRLSITPAVLVESSDNVFWNEGLFLPMEEVVALNEWISGEPIAREDIVFEEMLVLSTGRETTLSVVQQIEDMSFAISSVSDLLNDINNFFNLMRLILGGVGVVALVIAAFGVANTMMVAILERTSEIGLLKAIGARDRDVLLVFLLEAGLVGFVGGIAGVGVSLLLQRWLNNFVANISADSQLSTLINSAQLQGDVVIIPLQLLIFAVALATAVGVLAGIIPALRAARLSPAIALKQE
jgi:putative ABC transport system permease protein